MRQNGSCFIGEKRNVQNASEIHQNCVKDARQKCAEHLWGRTPFGRYRYMDITLFLIGLSCRKIRAGFRQSEFFADFYFWAAGFFRGFSRLDFFSSFLWEKVPRKHPPGKSPAKSSKIFTTKIPDTCLQRGRAKTCSALSKVATLGACYRGRNLKVCTKWLGLGVSRWGPFFKSIRVFSVVGLAVNSG